MYLGTAQNLTSRKGIEERVLSTIQTRFVLSSLYLIHNSHIPHLQGGDEEKFKLVVEAHSVLSDPRRRDRYDMGEDEDGMSDSSGMGNMNQMDLAELFAQFHGGGGFGGGFTHTSFGGGGSRQTHGFPY